MIMAWAFQLAFSQVYDFRLFPSHQVEYPIHPTQMIASLCQCLHLCSRQFQLQLDSYV